MKKNTNKFLAIAFLSILIFSACDPDKDDPIIDKGLEGAGTFILNEGNFDKGNSTIDYYNKAGDSIITDIFSKANSPATVGGGLQSFTTYKGKGYIVLNGSAVVKIVSLKDFKFIGEISGLSSPRYITIINDDKAYISDWGTNSIQVINLRTNTITRTITTGTGPEQMLLSEGKVYVANSGSFASDSTITVIDSQTDLVSRTILVADKPTAIKKDADGKIWVLCAGDYGDFTTEDDDTQATLYKISNTNLTVENSYSVGSRTDHPDRLAIDKLGLNLFYTASYAFGFGVRKHSVRSTTLNDIAFIPGQFYSIGIDKTSDVLFAGDAKDFVQKGSVKRFNTENGTLLSTLSVGIAPIGIQTEQ